MKKVTFLSSLLLTGVLIAGFAGTALAGGTTAGTDIDNRATVNYDVGTVPQTLIESSPGGNTTPGAGNGTDTDFLVDNLIDLSVVTQDAAAVAVTPGTSFGAGQYNVLRFRVTNEGNKTQDYSFSVVTVASTNNAKFGGLQDDSNMSPEPAVGRVFVNSVVDVAGTYENGTDTATFIDDLAPDSFFDVFLVLDAPGTLVDGNIASYHLVATTHDGGGVGLGGATVETGDSTDAWIEDTEQTVFGDGAYNGVDDPGSDAANDGKNSDQDDYIVASADLTVAKTVSVWSDPILGDSGNRKAIPGAVLTYTLTITNNGTANAVNVDITDSLNAEITAGNVSFVTRYDELAGAGFTCAAGEGLYVNGSCHTNASDSPADESEFTAGNVVTVNDLTVNSGGGTATVKFQVQITP